MQEHWQEKPIDGADGEVEWTSDAPAVATIDAAGLVTGVTPGQARLIARSGSATANLAVTVVANPVRWQSRTRRIFRFNGTFARC